MLSLWQDLRYAVRVLGKNPGFAVMVITTLALGIGANTAIFSLANALLLKNLPVRDPRQLVILTWARTKEPPNLTFSGASNSDDPKSGRSVTNVFTYPIYKAIQSRAQTLTEVFAFAPLMRMNVSDRGSGHSGIAVAVSGNYFSALGIQAAAGRLLMESDDQPGAPCTAAISYRYWQTAFAGDPSVVGRTVALNSTPCTIVGVTPQAFQGLEYLGFTSAPDLTVPLKQGEQLIRWMLGGKLTLLTADNHWGLQIMARLKPGSSAQQAQLETTRIFQQMLGPEWAGIAKEGAAPEVNLLPGSKGPNYMAEFIAKPVTILMVIVTLLLMIACANVASLFLAQGAARHKEFTVRLAVGSARGRLIRQLITESVLLVSLGGAAGFLLAWWGSRYLLAFLPSSSYMNLGLDVSPDLRVFVFTAVLSLVCGIVFGLGPALQATKIELSADLNENRRIANASGRGRLWSRKLLVAFQLAISLLLVMVAGLMVRTLQNLKAADLGFNPRNVLVFGLNPTANGYTGEKLALFYNRLLDRLNAIPGVASASASSSVLLSDFGGNDSIEVEEAAPSGQRMGTSIEYVAPHFFETMGIPLLAGRGTQSEDTATRPHVAIVNATFARRYFPNGSPLGRRFRWQGTKDWIEITGVAGDVKFYRVREEPPPVTYIPFLQSRWDFDLFFEVRPATNTATVVNGIYSAVRSLDPDLPVVEMKTQEEQIDSSLATERLFAKLASLFGALGLTLACVGLYGILAYNVARRTAEIGIRMALGADRRGILWLVLRQSLFPVLGGLAAGCLLALATTRLIASQLYGVAPTNAGTLCASMLLLFLVAMLAAWIPARRATKVDPMVALRYE